MAVRVAWLQLAPVKGMALVDRDALELTRAGVAENRRFFLAHADGRHYAGIRNGRLVAIRPEYDAAAERLTLRFPGGEVVAGDVELGERVETDFYGGLRPGRLVLGPFSEAIAAYAGAPVRLVRAERPAGGVDRGRGAVSLVSKASLDELARRSGVEHVDRRRFRMLVGVDGVRPHEEDGWIGRDVRLGGAVIRALEQVARCAITTQDPETGVPDFDTLRAIRAYRGPRAADGKSLDFGIYGDVRAPGTVRVGDAVEPL